MIEEIGKRIKRFNDGVRKMDPLIQLDISYKLNENSRNLELDEKNYSNDNSFLE